MGRDVLKQKDLHKLDAMFHHVVWTTPTINKMASKPLLKPSVLECNLQQLDTLCSRGIEPNVWDLEQYATTPHIAGHVLTYIQQYYGDIRDKNVLDLGCGCGILSIGCAMLGAKRVHGVDVDQTSLEIFKDNIEEWDLEGVVSITKGNVSADLDLTAYGPFDVVVMNPPFGTKHTPGIDRLFVDTALRFAPVVYSMHKLSTCNYWHRHGREMNCHVTIIESIKYNIKNQHKRHKKNSVNIEVGLLKFDKNDLTK